MFIPEAPFIMQLNLQHFNSSSLRKNISLFYLVLED